MDYWLELKKIDISPTIYELRLKSPIMNLFGSIVASAYYEMEKDIYYKLFLKTEQNNEELFDIVSNSEEANSKLYSKIKNYSKSVAKEKNISLEIKI